MKFFIAVLALAATAIALGNPEGEKTTCSGGSSVVCKGNGDAGFLSLGNVAPGALGESCSTGDVYCCSDKDIKDLGVLNLNLNVQCDLAHAL